MNLWWTKLAGAQASSENSMERTDTLMKKTNHTDKNGSRYFHQRDLIRPLSAGLLVASILVAWLTWSWVAYILAGIVAPVSLVMFFVAGARTVSDGDIAEQIEAARAKQA